MSSQAKLVVTRGAAGARRKLADLVMAWARDSVTGEPRYILELDKHHRGSHCGCECPSCGMPLTAVNAAKMEFQVRPHFRHPDGAEREECFVLAARAAALRQLLDNGYLDLPRRKVPGQTLGLSGKYYDAWVEAPAQKIQISQVDYTDKATAVVTMPDGRQLRVDLTGTAGASTVQGPDGLPVPTIFMEVVDPELASMDPQELRSRARLQPTELCWHAHWNDGDLQALADAAAREKALFNFDAVPDWLELPPDLDPALRRETILHHEVKRILEEVGRLTVPSVEVEVQVLDRNGKPRSDRWELDEENLCLSCVQLETRFGRLIPDVTCEAFDAKGDYRYIPLLIEVTVTNPIDEERLQRIRMAGEATVEIDLSKAGGRINRDELRQLVVEEVALKRWCHHPEAEATYKTLESMLTKRIAAEEFAVDSLNRWIAERREKVLATPIHEIAAEYLDAVLRMHDAHGDIQAERKAREVVADVVDKMAMHGYPEAGDGNMIASFVPRILTLVLGRPVGYRYDNVASVLNAIRQSNGARLSTLTVYFVAAKAYPPKLTSTQQRWFDDWAAGVRQSIKYGETTYLRDPSFDRVLSLVFPEMAAGLAKPFGKLSPGQGTRWDQERQQFVSPKVPERRRANFIATEPRVDRNRSKLLDTKPGDWWLKGRDLEAWKRANPEWARAWFPGDFKDLE